MTKQKLDEEFESCKQHLKSYLLRMAASVHDTEDLVQETYIKAHQKLDTFKGNSTMKTWLFAIGSNLARDHLRAKKRWPENVTDICREEAMKNHAFFQEAMQIREHSPQGKFEIKEHIAFCFTCIAKSLPLEQHLIILLKEVYDFKVAEIALITDLSVSMVKYYLHTARSKMTAIFDKRCSLINKEGICHQCTELNGIFNPKQNQETERSKISLVQNAQNPDKAHLFDLRTQLVKGIDPFESDAAELQLHHLEHNRKVMESYLEESGTSNA